MHFVERVLEHAHLPDVLGGVRFVENELDAELEVLALDAEVALVVDEVGDVVPLEELRALAVALSHHDAWLII